MKRIILVLVVILISTNTLHAANFKWTRIVTTIDGATEFYLDKNSVKKERCIEIVFSFFSC